MRRAVLGLIVGMGILVLPAAASAVAGSQPQAQASRAGVPLVRVHFEFRVEERATHYTVVNTGDSRGSLDLAGATYAWKLTPPDNDPACNNRGVLTGTGKEFVWRHGNRGDPVSDDACNHDIGLPGSGHPGDVDVIVKDAAWQCATGYTGTQAADGSPTGDGPAGDCETLLPPPKKRPDCDDELAAARAAHVRRQELIKLQERASERIKTSRKRLADVATLAHLLKGPIQADDDVQAALKAIIEAEAAFDRLTNEIAAAEKEAKLLSDAFTRCYNGKNATQSRAPLGVSITAICRAQHVALATAQARLSVYRWAVGALKPARLDDAHARLLHARSVASRAKASLAAGSKEARALGRVVTALSRAAVAVDQLYAVARSTAAKVKPTQKQVAKAKAALAACKK